MSVRRSEMRFTTIKWYREEEEYKDRHAEYYILKRDREMSNVSGTAKHDYVYYN